VTTAPQINSANTFIVHSKNNPIYVDVLTQEDMQTFTQGGQDALANVMAKMYQFTNVAITKSDNDIFVLQPEGLPKLSIINTNTFLFTMPTDFETGDIYTVTGAIYGWDGINNKFNMLLASIEGFELIDPIG